MNSKYSTKKWTILGVLTVMAATLAYCATAEKVPSEITGTVIDVSTNLPIEDAYVMAIYYESGSTPFGHSGHWCVKTKGMATGKDGTFRFPAEKSRLPQVHAIKPDYFHTVSYDDIKRPRQMERLWTGEERVVDDPNIYLKPQDPAKPKYSSFITCERPKIKEDVEANIEYLKLKLAEHIKYGSQKDSDMYRLRNEDLVGNIQRLKSIP